MTALDFLEAPFERGTVERSGEAQRRRHVVAGALLFELGEEPEPLLRERQRQRCRPVGRAERRQAGPGRLPDLSRQSRHRRRFEQAAHGQVDLQPLADPRNHPGREQGMAAEVEEVVIDADRIDGQYLAPDRPDQFLGRRARLDDRAVVTAIVGCGKRAAIDLATRRQRQRLEDDERRRDHVLGQTLLQPGPQDRGRRRGVRSLIASSRRDVRDETAIPACTPHDDGRLAHQRMLPQPRLDLAGLDTEAADLHLPVHASEELERSVRTNAAAIARAVQTPAAERIRHERAGGQIGTARDSRAPPEPRRCTARPARRPAPAPTGCRARRPGCRAADARVPVPLPARSHGRPERDSRARRLSPPSVRSG